MKYMLHGLLVIILLLTVLGCGGGAANTDIADATDNATRTERPIFKTSADSFVNFDGSVWKDDGYYKTGVEVSTRISDDGTAIIDEVTGLYWQHAQLLSSQYGLSDAHNHCQNLTLDNQNDWRLPSRTELLSFFADTNREDGKYYWFITTVGINDFLGWRGGKLQGKRQDTQYSGSDYVRCVRGTPMLDEGVFVPDSNFDVVVDTTTNLMWQDQSNGFQRVEQALGVCENLTLGGYTNWRLPSVFEVASLFPMGSAFEANISTASREDMLSSTKATTSSFYNNRSDSYLTTLSVSAFGQFRCVRTTDE